MSKGEKFTAKYGVSSATIYQDSSSTDALKIPPRGHPLYDSTSPTEFDEERVQVIDRDGTMTDPLEVWTDPDSGTLWVLDGRSRLLDVREVNRRRKERGAEKMVAAYIVPFNVPGADEKRAIARVRERNYHRRVPKPSDMAVDLVALRNTGYSWEDCAKILHVDTKDAEQFCRKLLPLAYCIPDAQAAIDSGELPRSRAAKFGGTAPDGSKALGKREQATLLAELLATKPVTKKPKALAPKVRERIIAALTNGASADLKVADSIVAKAVAAALLFHGGDLKALKAYPNVEAIVEEHMKPLPKGPKPTKVKKEKKEKESARG